MTAVQDLGETIPQLEAQVADIEAPGAPVTAAAPEPVRDDSPKWAACPSCRELVYLPKLKRLSSVCPECGHHGRLSARERLGLLLDEGSFAQHDPDIRSVDVLSFTDTKPYADRLRDARARNDMDDAVMFGTGRIEGHDVAVVVMEFRFLGGSMGAAVGEAVTRAAELALRLRVPLVTITASGGARMQEGLLSLMQMAKTNTAYMALREGGVPSISLLTDPTFGGVSASFATLSDVVIAEPGALIGFAGPRVVEKAVGRKLPDGFQRAEYLLEKGMVDAVAARNDLRPMIGKMLTAWGKRDVVSARAGEPSPVRTEPQITRGAWQVLRTARDITRPTLLDYVARICDTFVELHGDRVFGDDPAIIGGLATIDGRGVLIVGHQKGHDTKELMKRNFGMPHPEGYRKALRLFALADRWGLPVVTLVDTQGAYPGLGAEERGQAIAISEAIAMMSSLKVPTVSVVTGEGGSGGALAVAVSNRVLMQENSCYSVISPESCSTILFGGPERAEAMAEALRVTADQLLELGLVDGVVPEPDGGSQADHAEAARLMRESLTAVLDELSALSPHQIRRHRNDRFRAFGRIETETSDVR
nr:acetyl-CoA carboxylase carboxyltransferase subunit alpha [Kibdelosporangium sp. MJ126-NF4]CTQ97193.1 Acetyl-coenzyme A carboxyl transferase alpha chain (EC 6.4.1.2) [Kibdelosporangium sp. MJ126-NF4]